MTIAITGANGFVGTRLVTLLSKQHTFISLGYEEGFDIAKKEIVDKVISETNADLILHLAAYTLVDEAEKQKPQGKNSLVWHINVNGTKHIAQAAKKNNKHLIHISTDMVFGNTYQEWYHEKDQPFPENFYGITKYEAEQEVLGSGAKSTILRIAFPYTWHSEKRDFVGAFLSMLKEKKAFSSVADYTYAPTYIDDIATAIKIILEKDLTGIIHGASGEKWSGYEIAVKIAEKYGFDPSLVSKTTRAEFFKGRAPRSKNTALYNDTFEGLGVKFHTFEQALDEMPDESLTTSS